MCTPRCTVALVALIAYSQEIRQGTVKVQSRYSQATVSQVGPMG
jgi:hypothetical protein